MIQCSRCGSGAEEQAHTNCPICGAPLGSAGEPRLAKREEPQAVVAAQPNYLQAAVTPSSETRPPAPWAAGRVSLTGDVIQEAPSAAGPVPNYAIHSPVAQMPVRSGAPIPPRSGSYTMPARRETVRDNTRSKALMINMSVVFVLLLGCAGGGWWYWMHRTNPKAQVQRYLHAIQWLDWGVVYDLSASKPGGKTRHEFIEKMDEPYDNNGVIKIAARHAYETVTFNIGEPTINGDDATVPVTIGGGKGEDSGGPVQLKLKNFSGVWKIEPPSDNPLSLIAGDISLGSGLGAAMSGAGALGGSTGK